MAWIDSHCHLDFSEFDPTDALMSKLSGSGCERVLLPAISCDKFGRVLAFKDRFSHLMPNVDIALGLHPYFLTHHHQSHLHVLEKQLNQFSPIAVGEIGLDYMLDKETWQTQQILFEEQVQLAKQFSKPIVVHCRKAHDQVYSIIKRMNFRFGGFIHGFSGSFQQAKRYLDLGFAVGLGGALTYERAKAMHRMVLQLPDDGFVLETDSPDMAPSFEQGVNTPLNIPMIAEYIARLRCQPVQDIFQQTTQTYHRIMLNDQ